MWQGIKADSVWNRVVALLQCELERSLLLTNYVPVLNIHTYACTYVRTYCVHVYCICITIHTSVFDKMNLRAYL